MFYIYGYSRAIHGMEIGKRNSYVFALDIALAWRDHFDWVEIWREREERVWSSTDGVTQTLETHDWMTEGF